MAQNTSRPTGATQPDPSMLPLEGITVLDLTLARAGPTCVRHLADWGANVIRVEPPTPQTEDVSGRREGFDFQNLHRNKRAIRLDLKNPRGHAAFMRMVERADVIVENMRAPVKHRLKIAYDDVRKVNPRIVYGSISGFGQDGPISHRGGVDQIVQGMSGLMSITGLPGQGPVRVGIPISDLTAGNLLALGIMLALFQRERTGMGRWVTTSLLEGMIFMLDFQASRWLMKGEVAGQAGNDHPTGIPQGVFPASDGLFNISAASGRLWERFCDAIGQPDWKTKPEWTTQAGRSKDRKTINASIAEITRTKPLAHWIEVFEAAGNPCGPIYTIDQMFGDPQVKHLGMATPVKSKKHGDQSVVANPIQLVGTKRAVRRATPDVGEHTDEVLQWAGYSADELNQLRAEGVI